MTEVKLQRAFQLIESRRYAEAEKELKLILAEDPNDPTAKSLYAVCQAEQGQLDHALRLIREALSQQPDNDYFLYLESLFHLRKQNTTEGKKSILNAIAFNPRNADYFGILGGIELHLKNWKEALNAANSGLDIDPENLQCLNVRSNALFKLDNKEEAYQTIREALQHDPENEVTHTNYGWSILEQGDHKKALEHFREALKINPSYDYAKAGLVEALKARYLFYRIFLKYAFWVSNLKAKGQWALIIGLYIGVKVLGALADQNETLSMILTPIIYLYMAFAISTWVIDPLSNLFLRLNVYGRYALTKNEIQASNFVGLAFLVGLFGAVMMLFSADLVYLMLLIFGLTMMIPLGSMFNPIKKKNQTILNLYAAGLAVIGLLGITAQAVAGDAGILAPIYIIGIVVYQWVANAMTIR